MLFPKVRNTSVHTVKHITEQKLCSTFNNCSLCDRLNLRKKHVVCTLWLSVHMKSVIEQGFSMNSHLTTKHLKIREFRIR